MKDTYYITETWNTVTRRNHELSLESDKRACETIYTYIILTQDYGSYKATWLPKWSTQIWSHL